jgi:hypothetical protein
MLKISKRAAKQRVQLHTKGTHKLSEKQQASKAKTTAKAKNRNINRSLTNRKQQNKITETEKLAST